MRQRIMAFLLLLAGILVGIGLLLYFFYFRVGEVSISITNHEKVGEYRVEIYAKATTITTNKNCTKNPCVIEDMPAGEYTFTLSAPGYKDLVFSDRLVAGQRYEVVQTFEKDTKLELINTPDTPIVQKTPEQLKAEKIAYLREKKLYANIRETKYGVKLYSYNSAGDTIVKYGDEEVLRLRDDEDFSDIAVVKNENGEDMIFSLPTRFVWLGENSINSKEYAFAMPVLYFKDGIDNQKIIVTNKGSFDMNISSDELDYFVMFHDYVVAEDGIIGLVTKNDDQRKKNMGITQSGNVLVYYDRKTKAKNIIHVTSDTIQKIYKSGTTIYVEISGAAGVAQKYKIINL